jgi:prepilin-type processing-associated H-X9-DG protein
MSMPPQQPYRYDAPPPKKGMPVWGWVLIGCAGVPFLLIPLLAAILFPVFAQARAKAQAVSCLSNLKQQSLGTLMYSQDYDEKLPPTKDWMTKLEPYLKNEKVFHCPSAKSSGPEKAYGYAFNSTISTVSVKKITTPEATAMLFDSNLEGESASSKGFVPMTPARHNKRNNIAYADGHAKSIEAGN